MDNIRDTTLQETVNEAVKIRHGQGFNLVLFKQLLNSICDFEFITEEGNEVNKGV